MGLRDSLEGKAKKWALGKAHELLGEKDAAPAAAPPPAPTPAVPVDVQAQVGEQVVRSMFPGLGKWADDQQRQIGQKQAADAAQRRSAIAALPKAEVTMGLTGALSGQWSGQVPVKVEVRPGTTTPEPWQEKDPLVGQPTLVLELTPQDDQRPPIAGRPMASWRLSVPGCHGDGHYDLVAIARQRQTTGFDVPYDDCWLDLDGDEDAGDYQFYFYSDAGPSSATVADGGTTITASVTMAGAVGTVVGTLQISIPPAS